MKHGMARKLARVTAMSLLALTMTCGVAGPAMAQDEGGTLDTDGVLNTDGVLDTGGVLNTDGVLDTGGVLNTDGVLDTGGLLGEE